MEVSRVEDRVLVSAVEAYLAGSLHYKLAQTIFSRLKGYPIYVWGGVPRNALLKEIHGLSVEAGDLDILVDDSNAIINPRRLMRGLSGVCYTQF